MKFLSITGPKADIDRVVNDYLSKYEIHLENAMAQLTQVQHLSPYIQINPYRDLLAKVNEFASLVGDQGNVEIQNISLEEIQPLLDSLGEKISELRQECDRLMAEQASVTEDINRLFPFSSLPEDVDKLIRYRFVQVRFGRIQKEYYEKFNTFVYDDLDTMFYPCREDPDYVWGLYFVLWTKMEQVDAVFSSMHFERIYLKKDFYHGTPQELCSQYNRKLEELQREYDKRQEEIQKLLSEDASMILSARAALNALSTNFDVRKVAACVKEHQETFYILCGWMTEDDASAFMKDIEDDPKLFCVIEDDKNKINCKPPTKLKNPKIFRPFEMYVKMYGLPDYHEMDPTIFVAVTYSFIFGVMFGDVGQGLLLALGGFILFKKKHLDLAAIIGTAGIFSTFFGFMFGSIFGFEDIIDAVWLRPAEAMTLVPGLGNMNTIFVVAIVFGMFLILLTMVFHIINAVKVRNIEGTWFDQNAVCAFAFLWRRVMELRTVRQKPQRRKRQKQQHDEKPDLCPDAYLDRFPGVFAGDHALTFDSDRASRAAAAEEEPDQHQRRADDRIALLRPDRKNARALLRRKRVRDRLRQIRRSAEVIQNGISVEAFCLFVFQFELSR